MPDTRYLTVQLCGEAAEADGRGRTRLLDGETSAALVDRLNSLPAARPDRDCATAPGPMVDVVLEDARGTVVLLRVDGAACGVVYRDGAVRYGGDLVRGHVRGLLDRR